MNLSNYDFFKQNVTFKYKDSYYYKTTCGGFCSIFLFLILVINLIFLFQIMISRKAPEVVENKYFIKNRNIYLISNENYNNNLNNLKNSISNINNYSYSKFSFLIYIRDFYTNTPVEYDSTVLTIEMSQFNHLPNEQPTINIFKNKFCNSFGNISNEEFTRLGFNKSYCIEGSILLSDDKYLNNLSNYFDIKIKKCTNLLSNELANNNSSEIKQSNNLNCKSDEEIEKYLKKYSFELFYEVNNVDSLSYDNPIISGHKNVFHSYIPNNYRFVHFEMEINKYISYNSFLPDYIDFFYNIIEFPRVSIKSNIIKSSIPNINSDVIANFKFTSSPYQYVYVRHYLNIVDQLGSLGGSIYIIYSLMFLTISLFINYQYINDLLNSFYKLINPKYSNYLNKDFNSFIEYRYNYLIKRFIKVYSKELENYKKLSINNKDIDYENHNKFLKKVFIKYNFDNFSTNYRNKKNYNELNNIITNKEIKLNKLNYNSNDLLEIEPNSIYNLDFNEYLMDKESNALESYFNLLRIESIFGVTFSERVNYIVDLLSLTSNSTIIDNNNIKLLSNNKILDVVKHVSSIENINYFELLLIYLNNINIFNIENVGINLNIDDTDKSNIVKKNKINSCKIEYSKYLIVYEMLKYECFKNIKYNFIENLLKVIFCNCCFKYNKNKINNNKAEFSNNYISSTNKNINDKSLSPNKDNNFKNLNNTFKNVIKNKKSHLNNKNTLDDNNILNIKDEKFNMDVNDRCNYHNNNKDSYLKNYSTNLLEKNDLIETSKKLLLIDFDISKIIETIDKFDRFKNCFFDKAQLALFESSMSNIITYEDFDEDNQSTSNTKNKNKLKNNKKEINDALNIKKNKSNSTNLSESILLNNVSTNNLCKITYDKASDKSRTIQNISNLNKIIDNIIKRGNILPIEHSLFKVMGCWDGILDNLTKNVSNNINNKLCLSNQYTNKDNNAIEDYENNQVDKDKEIQVKNNNNESEVYSEYNSSISNDNYNNIETENKDKLDTNIENKKYNKKLVKFKNNYEFNKESSNRDINKDKNENIDYLDEEQLMDYMDKFNKLYNSNKSPTKTKK